jgi:hypothetical protein
VETVIWLEGSKGTMSSQSVFRRVRSAGRRVARGADGTLPERWLIAQWPDDQTDPVKYWLYCVWTQSGCAGLTL